MAEPWVHRFDLLLGQLLHIALLVDLFELNDTIYYSDQQFVTLSIYDSVSER